MDSRRLKADDLDICLEIHPGLLGQENNSRPIQTGIWKRLLSAPGCEHVLISQKSTGESLTVAAIGVSVFVGDAFVEKELIDPRPDLNCRIIQHALSRESVALNLSRVGEANGGDGLTVGVLAGRLNPQLTNEAEIQEARVLLAGSFATLHAGYRFKRIMIELSSKEDRRFAEIFPIMRIYRELGNGRALAIVERADLAGYEGSVLGPHYNQARPELMLKPSDQELLLAALEIATDRELAEHLHLSVSAVKRRWIELFARVGAKKPGLFEFSTSASKRGRGSQRRHLVLAYVRKHPEELRPYSRPNLAVRAASGDK